jgi:HSP20 family protein
MTHSGLRFSGVEHAAVAIRLVGHAEAGPGHPGNRQAVQDYLEVPGVEEKDIQITLDNDVLMVRGEKRQEQEKKEGGFHRVERSYGSFQRALNLPDDANQDSIKASFKNGVLTVTIDKREVSAPKQGRSIPING